MPDQPIDLPTVEPALTIEVPRGPSRITCELCGQTAVSTRGFVYRDGDAFAIYHAILHRHDGEPRIDLAIGIGGWQGDLAVADVSAFLAVWRSVAEIQFGFVDPSSSVWSTARLLQHQLTAEQARAGNMRRVLIAVAELVVRDDPSVASHLA